MREIIEFERRKLVCPAVFNLGSSNHCLHECQCHSQIGTGNVCETPGKEHCQFWSMAILNGTGLWLNMTNKIQNKWKYDTFTLTVPTTVLCSVSFEVIPWQAWTVERFFVWSRKSIIWLHHTYQQHLFAQAKNVGVGTLPQKTAWLQILSATIPALEIQARYVEDSGGSMSFVSGFMIVLFWWSFWWLLTN